MGADYYTYLYLREDGTPYYVGKGTGRRAYDKRRSVHLPPSKERIVMYFAESEQDAFETETALIWYYGRMDQGRGCLRNRTDGGEGVSGRVHTQRTRSVISAKKQGVKLTAKHRAAIAAARFGKKASAETKARMSRARKGVPIPNYRKGRHHTKATKDKTRQSLKLWWAMKKKGTQCLTTI